MNRIIRNGTNSFGGCTWKDPFSFFFLAWSDLRVAQKDYQESRSFVCVYSWFAIEVVCVKGACSFKNPGPFYSPIFALPFIMFNCCVPCSQFSTESIRAVKQGQSSKLAMTNFHVDGKFESTKKQV